MIKFRNCNNRCESGLVTGKACFPAPTRVRVRGKKHNYGVFRIGDLPEVRASFAKMYPKEILETKDIS